MKHFGFLLVLLLCLSTPLMAQAGEVGQLSPNEIQAAIAAKPNSGFVSVVNMGFFTPSECQAQMPEEDVFTPSGWINARAAGSKSTYQDFHPSEEDTARNLTVISKGCASGTPSGPVCDSITRVVILSDKEGTMKAEAVVERPLSQSWHNGFGVSASYIGLVSKFDLTEVQKIIAAKGEFLIATFNGSQLLKMYEVKKRFIKQLGM